MIAIAAMLVLNMLLSIALYIKISNQITISLEIIVRYARMNHSLLNDAVYGDLIREQKRKEATK